MQTLTLKLPRLHRGQRQVKAEAGRFNVLDCGRRWGKNVLGEDLLVEPTLAGLPTAWFAPTYKLLMPSWLHLRETFQSVTRRVSDQEHRLELITGGAIEMWTLQDVDAGRGRAYARVVIDEAAMVPRLVEAWNNSIRPTLTDYVGDAWFLSTPKGRNGFWQFYERANSDPEWHAWQRSSYENPHVPASDLDAQRRSAPERVFAQEILAQFLEDAGGVFRKVVAAATLDEQQPITDHQYVMGVDWAKSVDFTVLAVVDVTTRQLATMDRFNQVDWSLQRGRLAALYERYRPTTIIAEMNSIGEPNIEALRAEGLPVQGFTTTNATKAHIIEGLTLAFEQGALEILNDPVLVGELQAYEIERLPSGLTRYGAPEGMHDDTVIALALAWWGASQETELRTAPSPYALSTPREEPTRRQALASVHADTAAHRRWAQKHLCAECARDYDDAG